MEQITGVAALATNAGAIVLVTGIVQILKIKTESLTGSAKIRALVWALSFLVLFAANAVLAGTVTLEMAILSFANSVLVALGCFGAYNVAIEGKKTAESEKEE